MSSVVTVQNRRQETLVQVLNIYKMGLPQFFGLVFNWALYGLFASQLYTYHIAFPEDKRIYKAIVYTLLMLESAQTALLTYGRYQSFIVHFGDPKVTEKILFAWIGVPLISGLVGFMAHMIYLYRIYVLSKLQIVSAIIAMIALLGIASAIAESVHARKAESFIILQATVPRTLLIWCFSTAICDVLIAVFLTYYLLKRKGGLGKTTRLISKLIRLIVETGTITATVAVLNAVLFLALPANEAFNIPAFILGKLYSNSLLRLFNSRLYIDRGQREISSAMPNTDPFVSSAASIGGMPGIHNGMEISFAQCAQSSLSASSEEPENREVNT